MIRLDNLKDNQMPLSNIFFLGEHKYGEPSASVGGVSFPALPSSIESIKRFAIITAVAIGTTAAPDSPPKPQNLRLVFPAAIEQARHETAGDRYRRLKGEIVASGIPLLSDDELRQEIESRKGDRES